MERLSYIICLILFCSLNTFGQRNNVSAKKFGVVGNGISNDTKAMDDAVEYICKNGGTLKIPKGAYLLNGKTRVRNGVNGTRYIFLMQGNVSIQFEPGATLIYTNGFEGFRFRSTKDPNETTINKYTLHITGGNIQGGENTAGLNLKGNVEMWAFVGETLNAFTIDGMQIRNFYGAAALASYYNDAATVKNCIMSNVVGNKNDLIDNHGDGIYVGWTGKYLIQNNRINNQTALSGRLGRVGICIEYEKSRNGEISNNIVSGYDRGIHVELIKGTATIRNNKLSGNSSGIVLWNNYGKQQIVTSNTITNKGLSSESKPILYMAAPILLLGFNENNGSTIAHNMITIESGYFIPNTLLQVNSSSLTIEKNVFNDKTKSLTLSIAQGLSREKNVTNILFNENTVTCGEALAFDGSAISIKNNNFDVKKITVSFNKENNLFKGNKLPASLDKKNVQVYGKYVN